MPDNAPNSEPTLAVLDETVVYFSKPAKLPGRPAKSTLVNWKTRGVLAKRGPRSPGPLIYLEWAYIGGAVVTSMEAYERFQRGINGEEGRELKVEG